jgi:hypothetical protein
MPNKLPQTDPIATHRRKKAAAIRTGVGKKCTECPENRPEALIPNSNPTICAKHKRIKERKSHVDQHHVAGKANDSLTIPVDVNDHRAELSVAQQNWEQPILENPDGCPVIAIAGRIRGVTDTILYLLQKLVRWIPAALVALSKYLKGQLGPNWWIGTSFEQFAPQQ